MRTTLFIVLFVNVCLGEAIAQQNAVLYGQVVDAATGQPIEAVSVSVPKSQRGTYTDENGNYELKVLPDANFEAEFSLVGFELQKQQVARLRPNGKRKLDVRLISNVTDIKEVIISDKQINESGIIRENVEAMKKLPTTTGNIESVLPQIALGTTSGSGGELTSQYSVRGGSYDENLVYVNDFEVYRPQLVRSGQQEGLTFPNIDLIRDLAFSSGGFDARYGDKMASVLDIKYKRPTDFRASVGMGFLGGSAHIEGSVKKDEEGRERFRYLVGARYKTTKYLLGSLDVTGEYAPNFADVQTYLTYDINKDLQIGLLGNYNSSVYHFVPAERSTSFGLVDFALNLNADFTGQEIDDFTTYMGGLSLVYIPERKKNPYFLKLLASNFRSDENERIDIIGDYSLNQIETNIGSEDAGEVIATLGGGTQHQFVRNYLDLKVANIEHKGGIELQPDALDTDRTHFLQWGIKYQHEDIADRINEWERLDSAGYSLPFDPTQVNVSSFLKTTNQLASNRYNAYFQDTWSNTRDSSHEVKLTLGIRASYWDLNKEFIYAPRMQFLYKPLNTKKDISLRLAAGMYYQPAFYREMRRPDGTVNTDFKAQKSAHFVVGGTWDFIGRGRAKTKFRFIAEAYYKYLWDMSYYDLDNVRIRYSGENDTKGYVMGLDMRINGELVPGAESWINLSFLRAREHIVGVQHKVREVGSSTGTAVQDVPRPTDQLLQLAMFFQDYLPKNENFKLHLNFTVGTGWPFGIPDNNVEYRNTYRYNPYHRVDIGFSAQLYDRNWEKNRDNHPLRFTRNTWLSLEVFNLMKVSNEASNTWIKTVYNTQYAVPNYLTSRRVNLRLKMEF
jgi:hypothetical protein